MTRALTCAALLAASPLATDAAAGLGAVVACAALGLLTLRGLACGGRDDE